MAVAGARADARAIFEGPAPARDQADSAAMIKKPRQRGTAFRTC